MNTKNPMKSYLAQSVRTNGKQVMIVMLGILGVGMAFSLLGFIPEQRELVTLLIFDLLPKMAVTLIPIILIMKSKTYSEWCETNPELNISKKDFMNATFLENLFSSFLGVLPLVLVWITVYFVDTGMVDLEEGFGVLGGMFGVVWAMIGLVYSLQFSKLGNINEGAVLLAVVFLVPFWGVVAIQRTLHEMELSMLFVASVPAIIGFIVFIVSCPIAVRLQEKVEL